jgi:hypothetical protein
MSTSYQPHTRLGFAKGEAELAYPGDNHLGEFAEGESSGRSSRKRLRIGTFAEGQADPQTYPADTYVGTFADTSR